MPAIAHDEAARLARTVLTLRHKRVDHLPAELFGDQAWGMLLVLFIADADGERVTAYETFDRVGVAYPVGKRWFAALASMDLATSNGPCDGHNVIGLTARGITAIEACMQDAAKWMVTKPPVA